MEVEERIRSLRREIAGVEEELAGMKKAYQMTLKADLEKRLEELRQKLRSLDIPQTE